MWVENAAPQHLETHVCISADARLIRQFLALGAYFLLKVTGSEVMIAALQLLSFLTAACSDC